MNALRVVRPGVQTIVVDRGRYGLRHLGIAWGGAADRRAYADANALCGNGDAAALEITLGNAEFEFASDTVFALTGAEVKASLDALPVGGYRAHDAPAGSRLQIAFPERGTRNVLAVGGGFDVPAVLGSRTTDLTAGVGGWHGRALQRDDVLPIGTTGARANVTLAPPVPPMRVRVIPFDRFAALDAASQRAFGESEWTAGHESNRMGYRFSSVPLTYAGPPMQSHAVFPGFIQVPPSGDPIVLLCDAQTTGGYPTIGTVCDEDLWAIAQLRPGECVRFALERR